MWEWSGFQRKYKCSFSQFKFFHPGTCSSYRLATGRGAGCHGCLPGLFTKVYLRAVWGEKYPLIINSWRKNWTEIATFFKYPPEIRKIIYTTNMIESYHRQLRRVTKGKSIFTTDDALLKMLYMATQDVLRKWTGRIQNWGQILLQLSIYFADKVKSHLK